MRSFVAATSFHSDNDAGGERSSSMTFHSILVAMCLLPAAYLQMHLSDPLRRTRSRHNAFGKSGKSSILAPILASIPASVLVLILVPLGSLFLANLTSSPLHVLTPSFIHRIVKDAVSTLSSSTASASTADSGSNGLDSPITSPLLVQAAVSALSKFHVSVYLSNDGSLFSSVPSRILTVSTEGSPSSSAMSSLGISSSPSFSTPFTDLLPYFTAGFALFVGVLLAIGRFISLARDPSPPQPALKSSSRLVRITSTVPATVAHSIRFVLRALCIWLVLFSVLALASLALRSSSSSSNQASPLNVVLHSLNAPTTSSHASSHLSSDSSLPLDGSSGGITGAINGGTDQSVDANNRVDDVDSNDMDMVESHAEAEADIEAKDEAIFIAASTMYSALPSLTNVLVILLVRMFAIGFLLAFSFSFAGAVVFVIFSEPLKFGPYLLSGLADVAAPRARLLAFRDLLRIAETDARARLAILAQGNASLASDHGASSLSSSSSGSSLIYSSAVSQQQDQQQTFNVDSFIPTLASVERMNPHAGQSQVGQSHGRPAVWSVVKSLILDHVAAASTQVIYQSMLHSFATADAHEHGNRSTAAFSNLATSVSSAATAAAASATGSAGAGTGKGHKSSTASMFSNNTGVGDNAVLSRGLAQAHDASSSFVGAGAGFKSVSHAAGGRSRASSGICSCDSLLRIARVMISPSQMLAVIVGLSCADQSVLASDGGTDLCNIDIRVCQFAQRFPITRILLRLLLLL